MKKIEIGPVIVLKDEKGNETEFEFLEMIPYRKENYIVLIPVDETSATSSVTILKVEPYPDQNEQFVTVDSEDDLFAIYSIFKNNNKEIFNFLD